MLLRSAGPAFKNGPGPVVLVLGRWLTWGEGVVLQVARAIYDGHRFSDLSVLADALEEAGCSEPEILGHLRGPGDHVRGCWALDIILSKDR